MNDTIKNKKESGLYYSADLKHVEFSEVGKLSLQTLRFNRGGGIQGQAVTFSDSPTQYLIKESLKTAYQAGYEEAKKEIRKSLGVD